MRRRSFRIAFWALILCLVGTMALSLRTPVQAGPTAADELDPSLVKWPTDRLGVPHEGPHTAPDTKLADELTERVAELEQHVERLTRWQDAHPPYEPVDYSRPLDAHTAALAALESRLVEIDARLASLRTEFTEHVAQPAPTPTSVNRNTLLFMTLPIPVSVPAAAPTPTPPLPTPPTDSLPDVFEELGSLPVTETRTATVPVVRRIARNLPLPTPTFTTPRPCVPCWVGPCPVCGNQHAVAVGPSPIHGGLR